MRADARRNYDRLLAEAHTAFAEHGVDASLEEVARRAGVGIGTLYRHFPTREALLETLLHGTFEALRVEAEQAIDATAPRVALAGWLRSFATRSGTYRGLPASVLATAHAEGSALADSCRAMTEAGFALVRRAQRAKAIRQDVEPADVLALAGAIAWLDEQAPVADGRSDRLLGLIMDALDR